MASIINLIECEGSNIDESYNTSVLDAHSESGVDGVETDDGDLQTPTDNSVRLDRVGVSSAEDSSDEGTVNRLSLIHWASVATVMTDVFQKN